MGQEQERLYLREHRRAAGLKQYELAAATQWDKSSISRIENGIQDPGVKGLIELAGVLDCRPADLFAPPVNAAA